MDTACAKSASTTFALFWKFKYNSWTKKIEKSDDLNKFQFLEKTMNSVCTLVVLCTRIAMHEYNMHKGMYNMFEKYIHKHSEHL